MTQDPITPTADLCDNYGDAVRVLRPGLQDFGGCSRFSGTIVTLRVRDDNVLVRQTLSGRGVGCVLVIDGGGSVSTALLGDNLGQLAVDNGWSGVVVWGAVRDTAALRQCQLGIRALAACPRRSGRTGAGERDVSIEIGGLTIDPGHWLAADDDGIVVAARALA